MSEANVENDFRWLNPPAEWSGGPDRLELRTDAGTDFWRETFYGFVRDTGHAFVRPVAGDFTASATVLGAYETLYDQAGLFLRADEKHWIKAGIEFTDNLMHFSVVATNGVSDWSVIPLPNARPTDPVFVRLSRHGGSVRVQFRLTDRPWQMARLAPFPETVAQVGIMACSPERAGFHATFQDISVGPAIPRDLHAASI